MSDDRLRALATGLEHAWARAVTVPAPSTVEPALTVAEAYAIQEMVIAARVRGGRRRAGWKMGLTSADPPATPIVGTLLSDMILPSGANLDLGTLVAPMVEAELVVRIGERIDRAVTVAELGRGPHEVGPGIEVIDYRCTDSSGVVDWIADNSTVAYAIVGDLLPVAVTRPAEIEVVLSGDGHRLAGGRGSQVMGHPLAAVSWLSGHLLERGHALESGHVVLTGSLTGHHAVASEGRSRFTADFGALGAVAVGFHR